MWGQIPTQLKYKTVSGTVHNAEIIKRIYNIPENHRPILMITLGKAAEGKVRPRGYRKPVGEFVRFVD